MSRTVHDLARAFGAHPVLPSIPGPRPAAAEPSPGPGPRVGSPSAAPNPGGVDAGQAAAPWLRVNVSAAHVLRDRPQLTDTVTAQLVFLDPTEAREVLAALAAGTPDALGTAVLALV
ncbi:hypothetical protein OOT08_07600, partial [Leucobacter sp. M11]|nr:hypothetical protein [Leucobacter sp. M11]